MALRVLRETFCTAALAQLPALREALPQGPQMLLATARHWVKRPVSSRSWRDSGCCCVTPTFALSFRIMTVLWSKTAQRVQIYKCTPQDTHRPPGPDADSAASPCQGAWCGQMLLKL